MSGLFLKTFAKSADEEGRSRILRDWRRIAPRVPTDTLEVVEAPTAVAGTVSHGQLRGTGIAHDPARGLLLCIAGAYWCDDSARQLSTPAEALQALRTKGLSDRPTLRGNYSFVLVNAEEQRLFAESDPFGVVPLYYASVGSELVFGTELKFISPELRPRLDRDAVAEYLTIGYLVSDHTLLEGVRRLPAGSRLTAGRGSVTVSHFPLEPFARNEEPSGTLYDELDDLFDRAIGRYAADAPRVSVSLSGGVDSRIALLAAVDQGLDVEVWTAGEPGSLECRVAKNFCRKIGIPIKVHVNRGDRLPSWFDRGVWTTEARCPPGHSHYFDAMFAGQPVLLPQVHGLIGDAVAGGDFDLDRAVPAQPRALEEFCRSYMQSVLYWPEGSRGDLGLERLASPADVLDRVSRAVLARCPKDDAYSTFLWSRYQFRVFGFTVPCLMSQVTPWMDVVTPYLDPEFFASCARIATPAILDRRAQIEWAARRHANLCIEPRVKDGVLIPFSRSDPGDYGKGVRRLERTRNFRYLMCRLSSGRINLPHRETYPFYGAWFRKYPEVSRFFSERLLSPDSLDRGLWRREGVARLIRDLEVGRNVWDSLATMLLLETFARIFVDGSLVPSASEHVS